MSKNYKIEKVSTVIPSRMNKGLAMWVIYDHPKDYPNNIVTRKWEIGLTVKVDSECTLSTSLNEARTKLPFGLFRIPRFKEDDPVIIESWI